jgi:hypothetical protein
MYRVGNLSIEASTLIFDPYKVVATGMPDKWCYVRVYRRYDQEDFQDMNQVTRRGTNWRSLVSNGEDKSIEFSDGPYIASRFTNLARLGAAVTSTCCTPVSAGRTRPLYEPRISPMRSAHCKFGNTIRRAR